MPTQMLFAPFRLLRKQRVCLLLFFLCLTSMMQAQPVPCIRATTQTNTTINCASGCAVRNPDQAVDNDVTTYAELENTGPGGQSRIFLQFPSTGRAGDSIRIVFSGLTSTDVSKFRNVTIGTYDGNVDNNDLDPLNAIDAVFTGTAPSLTVTFPAEKPFNKVYIVLSIITNAGAPSILRVNYAQYMRPAPTVANTSVSVCKGGSATLQATAPANAVFKWYTQPVGGTAIFTGANFTTPALDNTTVYYAETTGITSGCTQPSRTKVTVNVLPVVSTFKKLSGKTFGGKFSDRVYDMVTIPNSIHVPEKRQYVLIGTSNSGPEGPGAVPEGSYWKPEMLLTRLDSGYHQLSEKRNGPANGQAVAATSLVVDNYIYDDVLAAGYGEDFRTIQEAIYTLYSAYTGREESGEFTGRRTDDGSARATVAISTQKDTSFLVGGFSFNDNYAPLGQVQYNNGKADIWVRKLGINILATSKWERMWGGTENDILTSAATTADGGYILAGYTNSADGDVTDGNNGAEDVWIIKLNADGRKQWDKTYGGSLSDKAAKIIQTADGGYLIAGTTASSDKDVTSGNKGLEDFWVIKTDSLGKKQWDKTYGGSDFDVLTALLPLSDGGYILGGYTRSSNGDITSGNKGEDDFLLITITADGQKMGDLTLGGSKTDRLFALQPALLADEHDLANKYVAAGYTYSKDGDITTGNKGLEDAWIIKIQITNGCPLATRQALQKANKKTGQPIKKQRKH
ncbi:immunoglobulin domain-containing protein [Chitinophaga nivalis]|uniref:Ig-like domain-containing protein n=1 Tax=Chitinophaga nivalis TaxID=2991709 RepID=A0ABT3INF4_9BACT|nr:hypothetical protein [Chitinophaga nivalis]MCW3464826.1 hypothetical protein [Chitinophaga nivalis]MCW3485483.1 hypothetical protein [Chitinophaga nivalis]